MSVEVKNLSITDRVAAGMAFLDQHFPGHVGTVELENLRVYSGAQCPLAQASHDYYSDAADMLADQGIIDLREQEEGGISRAQALGFMELDDESRYRLDQAWIEAYEQRIRQ